MSIDLAPLPLRVGWAAILFSADASTGAATASIQKLGISGPLGTISGDIDLQFDALGVSIPAFNAGGFPTKTASTPSTTAKYTFVSFGTDGFGLDWINGSASPVIGLFSSELADNTGGSSDKLQLRVRISGRELEEIRLDWGAEIGGRNLTLPGFGATLPKLRMISLIIHRDDAAESDLFRLALIGTVDPTTILSPASPDLELTSTFCWPLENDSRENLRDGNKQPSDKFVTLTVHPRTAISFVLFDIPLGKGSPPQYLAQLRKPMSTLESLESSTAITTAGGDVAVGILDPGDLTPIDIIPLSIGSASLKLEFGSNFTLPFLNIGDQSIPPTQSITLTAVHPTVDPVTLNIACTIDVLITIAQGETVTAQVDVIFDLRRMAFLIDRSQGLWLRMDQPKAIHVFDLAWTISPAAGTQIIPDSIKSDNPSGIQVNSAVFVITVQNGNYSLRLAPGATIEIEYDRATSPDQPIRFLVKEFALTPKGIDLVADVTNTPAKFNGLETQFQFKSGSIQIHESKVAGFTIAGSGPLPRGARRRRRR